MNTVLIEMKSNLDGDGEAKGDGTKLLFGSATTSGFSSEGRDRKVTYYEPRHVQSVDYSNESRNRPGIHETSLNVKSKYSPLQHESARFGSAKARH
jgi:hypothetical protein